jgi:putative hydrolase of the HAD superfamily
MLKAILFDVDDTLIDWSTFTSDWVDLESQYLNGVFDYINAEIAPLDDFAAYKAEFRNRSNALWTAARTNLRAPNIGAVLIECAVALGAPADKLELRPVLEHYNWGKTPGTTIFAEVHDVMMQLRGAGIKVGVVTNAYQPMMLREIEMHQHGILDYFPECRISAADVGFLKPHPAIFHTALTHIGSTPEETVFVGDDPEADVVGAQGVGMKAVLRQTPRRYFDPDNDEIRPDAIVDTLSELFPLLDEWYPGWRKEHADVPSS